MYKDCSIKISQEKNTEVVSVNQYFYIKKMIYSGKTEEEILKVCKEEFNWEDDVSYFIINTINHDIKRV
jgi:hypothetical protein